MAYDNSAAAELEGATPEEGAPAKGADTFFLPADFPGREDYKAGDTITLKIVGEDEDGRPEVECVDGGGEEKDWKTDMRDTMGPNMDGNSGV